MVYQIMIPHDGTEISDIAFERAVEYAKALGAEIVLVHVIEDISQPLKDLEKWWEKVAHAKIHELENQNLVGRSKCLFGDSADRIIQFAADNEVNLIVLGSHRLKGVSKIKALGSVARKVIENADCPVMIVH